MASFLALSAELKLIIIDNLGVGETNKDIRNLGCTCKALRAFLAPQLFRNLTLRNNEKTANAVATIASSAWAEHVRQVHYRGVIQMAVSEEQRMEGDPGPAAPSEKDFPASVEAILADLSRFPKLEKVIVEFNFDEQEDDDIGAYSYGLEFINEDKDDEEMLELEEKEAWRALLVNSYRAILKNKPGVIRALEIRNLPHLIVSPWTKPEWPRMLGELQKFDLSIRGGDNGIGYCVNCYEGYAPFIAKIDEAFSAHLVNITHLRFAAPCQGPLGLEGEKYVDMPLSRTYMPKLQVLELEYCFIGPRLVHFIRDHSGTLEHVRLKHCMSAIDDWQAEYAITWAQIFDSVVDAQCSKLTQFEVLPVEVPVAEFERQDVEKELAAEEGSRLFAYRALNPKYGTLFDNEKRNIIAWREKRDWASWERLLAAMENNNREN